MTLLTAELPEPACRADEAPDLIRALFARLADGERAALGELYDQAARSLFGLALVKSGSRALAEEAVQETFARLASSRANLAAVKRPRAYLFATLSRSLADLLRKNRRHEALSREAEAALLEPRVADPLHTLEVERLNAAVRRLSPKLREAVYLRYLEELSLREVAAATAVPLFTAASRCRLGLARLRRLLEGRSR